MKLPNLLIAILFVLCACQSIPPVRDCKHTDLACDAHAKAGLPPASPVGHSRCLNALDYAGQIVGDGHCVSLIRSCTELGSTSNWRPGKRVRGANLPRGTIIATFDKNKYPNKTGFHAAIFIEHHANGFWVWDQWQGMPVHKRLIRYRQDGAPASNSAQAYRVVLSKQ